MHFFLPRVPLLSKNSGDQTLNSADGVYEALHHGGLDRFCKPCSSPRTRSGHAKTLGGRLQVMRGGVGAMDANTAGRGAREPVSAIARTCPYGESSIFRIGMDAGSEERERHH